MENIIMFVAFGIIVLWAIAWLIAFVSISYTTLSGMIGSVFTLRGIGWSLFCAALALIPLFVILLLRARFEATYPG
jgi:hypothetical protein